MVPSSDNQLASTKIFIVSALALLLLGMVFGILGAIQYVQPGFLKEMLSFEKIPELIIVLD